MYTETELLDLIDDWHDGSDPRTLNEFLGWTWEEYKTWIHTGKQPDAKG